LDDAGEDVLGLVETLARRHRLRIASVISFEHDGRSFAVARLIGAATDLKKPSRLCVPVDVTAVPRAGGHGASPARVR
jgi:hypothetical protein